MHDKTNISVAKNRLWQDLKTQYSFIERTDVYEKVKTNIEESVTQISRHLEVENPFYNDLEALCLAETDFKQNGATFEKIEKDISGFDSFKQKTGHPAENFWQEKLSLLKNENAALPKKSRRKKKHINPIEIKKKKDELIRKTFGLQESLHKKWREELDQAYSEWEFEQINNFRKKIFEQLQSWLELLQKLFSLLNDLSIEPGLLFDLSKGNLTDTDIEILRRWVDYISQDNGVKKLCDMLGRLRQAEHSKREEIIKYKTKINIDVIDTNSKEEIVGIKLGNDIENAIPEELALLADDDSSLLFDLKFIENRIMCFETQGLNQEEQEIEKKKKVEIHEDEKMGPIIICVDTSGSMQGSPETIAKAITLYMATRAASQNRNCYLINFSTSIETLDLSAGIGLKETINFLKKSFHGGTDAAPALEHALSILKKESYQQSDILTISDFIMGRLPESIFDSIAKVKKEKNNFYSLCIGEQFMNKKINNIFDKEWIYNPNNRSVHEIHSVIQAIAQ